MKTYLKKVSALFIAFVMMLAMSVPAFAAEEADSNSATIFIDNAENATLKYVQVIEPDRTTETGWKFSSPEIATAYRTAFGLDSDQAVINALIRTVVNDGLANTTQISNALSNVRNNSSIETKVMDNPQTVNKAGVYAIFGEEDGFSYNNMAAYIGFGETKDGVYPVLVSKEIDAKKSPDEVNKGQSENDNAAAIGDVVEYTITSTVPFIDKVNSTHKEYKIVDKITGAEYVLGSDNKVAVTVTMGTDATTETVTDYTVEMEPDGNSFTMDLTSLITDDNANAGKTVTIKYEAKVTGTTVKNKAGHDWEDESKWDETKVFTGEIDVIKHDTKDESKGLPGAGFEVRNSDSEDAQPMKFTGDAGEYVYAPNAEEGTYVTELVTGAGGKLVIKGLDEGTYYLKEVTAPEGYQIGANDITKVELGYTGDKAENIFKVEPKIPNTTLSELPSTGGMGTYLFTIVGVVIMAAAAGMLFMKRRGEAE